MNVRPLALFVFLLLAVALTPSAAVQIDGPKPILSRSSVSLADTLLAWEPKRGVLPQNIEATGEKFGDREIMRGTIHRLGRSSEVEFVRGDLLVAVRNVEEGRDPAVYITSVVADHGLVYADSFRRPIPNALGEARYHKARLTAPDDRAFIRALESLQRLPLVRYARINHVMRFDPTPE